LSKRRLGFTLIELLLVVAIISLLIAIVLPNVKMAKENAITAVCKARLGQLYLGHSSYSFDHTGQFPHYNDWLWTGPKGTPSSSEWVEHGQVWKYVRNREMYFCPKDNKLRDPGTLAIGNRTGNGDVPIHTYIRAYEVHSQYASKLKQGGFPGAEADARAFYLRPKAIRPGMMLPIGGSLVAGGYASAPAGPHELAMLWEEATTNTDLIGPDTSWALLNDGYSFFSGIQDMMTQRHLGQNRGNGHIMYWDGHAALVDSVKFNSWYLDKNPEAERDMFGVR
jgi:prepilin-type N-terminal cleavage/methylation domain-containing protein